MRHLIEAGAAEDVIRPGAQETAPGPETKVPPRFSQPDQMAPPTKYCARGCFRRVRHASEDVEAPGPQLLMSGAELTCR